MRARADWAVANFIGLVIMLIYYPKAAIMWLGLCALPWPFPLVSLAHRVSVTFLRWGGWSGRGRAGARRFGDPVEGVKGQEWTSAWRSPP